MTQIKCHVPDHIWNEFSSKTDAPNKTLRQLLEDYNQENDLTNIMSCADAAELWELSPGYVKHLCQKGKLKARCIGKTWIINKNQPNPKKNA